VTQIISSIQAFILAILAITGSIQIWHIVVLSIALGCINAFDIPSRHSFVIEMVEKKEDLGNAIALNSMMFNGARLLGPSVAGLMLATTGEGVCFMINAISYLFVIISLLLMKVKSREIKIKESRMFSEMKEGLRYTFGFAPIRYLILLLGVVSLMGSSYQVLMPVYAKEVLGGGSDTFGFLMGAAGMGALLGALYLASKESILKLGRIIPLACGLFGIGLISIAFSRVFLISLIILVFAGMGMMLHTASSNTILQTITDDDKRGRVMGFYTMAIMGTAPFGSLIAGALAKAIGTPATIFAGGAACLAGAIIFFRKLPELRTLIRPVYVKMGIIPEVAAGIQTATEPAADTEDITSAG
jgi:MFS family permease